MFGLSFNKLLLLVIVVIAVWYGYKYVTRVNQVRQAATRDRARGPQRGGTIGAEDMAKCASCGAYVARGAASCGRGDCPYSG
jgi:hypothetical protein